MKIIKRDREFDELDDICERYKKCYEEDPAVSKEILAIVFLYKNLESSNASTLVQLQTEMTAIKERLSKEHKTPAITSACELFMRYITLKDYDHDDFNSMKETFMKRGKVFITNASHIPSVIGKSAKRFVRDGSVILTHSYSVAVLEILKAASESKTNFRVYVTECYDKSGVKMAEMLREAEIEVITIVDAAVGYVMERIDFVLVGSHAITESGGSINTLGSYQIALMAKQLGIPLYIAAESYKLLRIYPITQKELGNECKYENKFETKGTPERDYTPPSLITLHFTDFGIFTTSAMSDEIIKLYT